MTPRSTVVVGGRGAVGSMYARAFADVGHPVRTLDLSIGNDVLDPDSDALIAIARADVVILAVPETVALEALGTVAEVMTENAVLVETLSVKTAIAAALGVVGGPFAAVGVNPLFAPSLGMAGRVTAVVPHRPGPATTVVTDVLAAHGSKVVTVSAEDHDRTVATTQALTHAAVLAFGLAAVELGVDPAMAAALGPPPHATLSALLARVSTGTPKVYHDVQHGNPMARPARAALSHAVRTIDDAADSDSAFAAVMARAGQALGTDTQRYLAHCIALFGIPMTERAEPATTTPTRGTQDGDCTP